MWKNEYIYLGQTISFHDNTNKEITRRTDLGWKKYWSLKKIFKTNTPRNLKSKVFKACVLPTLLYGTQTWASTSLQARRLQSTVHSMQRSMLGLKKIDKVKLETINNYIRIPNITNESKRIKWSWAGHVSRMSDSRWAKRTTEWTPLNFGRRRGRPTTRWRDEIVRDAGINWSTKARSREAWKALIETQFPKNKDCGDRSVSTGNSSF